MAKGEKCGSGSQEFSLGVGFGSAEKLRAPVLRALERHPRVDRFRRGAAVNAGAFWLGGRIDPGGSYPHEFQVILYD